MQLPRPLFSRPGRAALELMLKLMLKFRKGGARYAIVTKLPAGRTLSLPPDLAGSATLLETGERLAVEYSSQAATIVLPAGLAEQAIPVIRIE